MAHSSLKTVLNAVTVHSTRELAGPAIKVNGVARGLAPLTSTATAVSTPEDDVQIAW
jgi:hypothetical protein